MNEQPQFLSRRELREAERAGLIEANELPFDGVPRVESVEVPARDNGSSLTRRQLRELEKTGGILAVHTSQVQLPALPAEAPATGAVAQAVPEPEQDAPATDTVLAEREEPLTLASPIVAAPAQVEVPVEAEVPVQVEVPARVQPTPIVTAASAQLDAQAVRAAAAYQASEFEALLSGAVVKGSREAKRRGRRIVMVAVIAGLLLVAGGLLFAASALGYLG